MKRFAALALAAVLVLPAAAEAAGGFQGPGSPAHGSFHGPDGGHGGPRGDHRNGFHIDSVAAAKNARDDAPVALTGHIVRRLRPHDDEYVFRDRTGEIRVEIDDRKFAGHRVTPDMTVRLFGEVDRSRKKGTVKIDVKRLEILR